MKHSPMKQLTSELAEQVILDHFLSQEGCVRVYQVQETWQAEELKRKKHVCAVNSVTEFREAFDKQGTDIIFVPKDAAITSSQARNIMKTVTQDRVVFWQAAS